MTRAIIRTRKGLVTVTIPAGAVPTGSTIVVINNASGATVTTDASRHFRVE